jgi:hypothetical protein
MLIKRASLEELIRIEAQFNNKRNHLYSYNAYSERIPKCSRNITQSFLILIENPLVFYLLSGRGISSTLLPVGG